MFYSVRDELCTGLVFRASEREGGLSCCLLPRVEVDVGRDNRKGLLH